MGIIEKTSLKNRLCLLSVCILLATFWASAFPLTAVTLHDLSSPWIVTIRLIGAAIVVSMCYGLINKRLPPVLTQQGFVLGIIGTLLPFLFITLGQQKINSSTTSLLAATVPIFTLLLMVVCLRKRLCLLEILGCLLAMAGVLLILGLDNVDLKDLWYAVSILLGVLGFAVANVYGGQQTHRTNALSGFDLATSMLNTAGLAAFCCVPFLIYFYPADTTVDAKTFWSLTGLTLLPTLISSLLFFWLLKQSNAILVSIAGAMVPVAAVLIGTVLLGEPFTKELFMSLILIVAGGLLVVR